MQNIKNSPLGYLTAATTCLLSLTLPEREVEAQRVRHPQPYTAQYHTGNAQRYDSHSPAATEYNNSGYYNSGLNTGFTTNQVDQSANLYSGQYGNGQYDRTRRDRAASSETQPQRRVGRQPVVNSYYNAPPAISHLSSQHVVNTNASSLSQVSTDEALRASGSILSYVNNALKNLDGRIAFGLGAATVLSFVHLGIKGIGGGLRWFGTQSGLRRRD